MSQWRAFAIYLGRLKLHVLAAHAISETSMIESERFMARWPATGAIYADLSVGLGLALSEQSAHLECEARFARPHSF